MKILISGGGIAGLTLAYWLRRYDFEPVVVERMPDHSHSRGFLIDFWGPGYSVVERMGLVEELGRRSHEVEKWAMVNGKGKITAAIAVEQFTRALRGRLFTFYRGDLEEVLYEQIKDSVEIRWSTTLEGLHLADNHIEATLSDSTTSRYDLAIGADGIHSKVRELAFGEEKRFIRHLGYHVAACTVPAELEVPANAAYLYNEPDRLAMVFPCAPGQVVAYFVYRTDEPKVVSPSKRAGHLQRIFSGMGWVVPQLLENMDEETPIFLDTVSQIRMPRWSQGRVALVGDACQCLTLLAGQGASMATVGAYHLAGELHRSRENFSAAFNAYEAKMKPAIVGRQREAKRMSRWFFVPRTRLGIAARNCLLRLFSTPFLFNLMLPALTTNESLESYEERQSEVHHETQAR